MKTKLATLLIAPALLFTACGAKEISIKEAYEYASTHFTEEKDIGGKVQFTWDFKDSDENGIKQLATLANGTFDLKVENKTSGNGENSIQSMYQFVIKKFEDFEDEMSDFCNCNVKFYKVNNLLNMRGDYCNAAEDAFMTIHMSFVYDEKGYHKEIKFDCERFAGKIEGVYYVMNGNITATYTHD